jgi:hypothetical protein
MPSAYAPKLKKVGGTKITETFERADSLRRILTVMAVTPAVCVSPYFIGAAIEVINIDLSTLADNIKALTLVAIPLGLFVFLLLLVMALNLLFQKPRFPGPIQIIPSWSKQMRWAIICSAAPFVAYLGSVIQASAGPRWYLQDEIQLPANTLFFGSIVVYIYGLIQIAIAKIIDKKNGEPIS